MKKSIRMIYVILILLLVSGCEPAVAEVQKLKDLEFTVVAESHVPEEFGKIIEERKAEAFKLTYRDEGWMYVAEGYGVQKGGGYSIQVNACYETENAVYLDTNLLGAQNAEEKTDGQSFPYIVLKMENIDKNVVFR